MPSDQSVRAEALKKASVLWDEVLSGENQLVEHLGVTEAVEDIEGRLQKGGLDEREARVLSDWAFRGVIRQGSYVEIEASEPTHD